MFSWSWIGRITFSSFLLNFLEFVSLCLLQTLEFFEVPIIVDVGVVSWSSSR